MSRNLIEDQTLIDRLSINDTDAFEELYCRYWPGLYLYCVKKLQSPADAKIVVRDMFIAIWEKRSELPVTFSISRHLYEEVRKQVVKSLNQKLTDTKDTTCIENWLIKEFSAESLQAAKKPVRKKFTIINTPSELMRQQTNMLSETENSTLANIKWMFQSLTTKLSLANILSYPKN